MEDRKPIAFDARLFGSAPTGIGRWMEGLLPAFLRIAPDRPFVAFGPAAALNRLDAENLRVVDARPRRQLLWQLTRLPVELVRCEAAAFLSPFNFVTAPAWTGVQLAWIHDLIPLHAGGLATQRWKMRLNLRLARSQATAFVTISEFTRADVVRRLGLPLERLRVVPPGLDPRFFEPADGLERVRARYGLGDRYLLVLGGAEPRKNVSAAVEAWCRLSPEQRGARHLAVVGGPFKGRSVRSGMSPDEALRIRDLGRVPDADLPALYQGAEVVLYPSRDEGFGLPPLEAMASGTPVIASNRTAVPEATGRAALCVPPEPAAFAGALKLLFQNPEMQEELKQKGAKRAARFTWEKTARSLLDILDDLC